MAGRKTQTHISSSPHGRSAQHNLARNQTIFAHTFVRQCDFSRNVCREMLKCFCRIARGFAILQSPTRMCVTTYFINPPDVISATCLSSLISRGKWCNLRFLRARLARKCHVLHSVITSHRVSRETTQKPPPPPFTSTNVVICSRAAAELGDIVQEESALKLRGVWNIRGGLFALQRARSAGFMSPHVANVTRRLKKIYMLFFCVVFALPTEVYHKL